MGSVLRTPRCKLSHMLRTRAPDITADTRLSQGEDSAGEAHLLIMGGCARTLSEANTAATFVRSQQMDDTLILPCSHRCRRCRPTAKPASDASAQDHCTPSRVIALAGVSPTRAAPWIRCELLDAAHTGSKVERWTDSSVSECISQSARHDTV